MPRQQGRQQFLNFVGGLNTESSPLTFPQGTAKALDNVDLNRDGSIERRRGLDFEIGGAYSTTSFTNQYLDNRAITRHEWVSVNGDDSLNFAVIQVGGTLYFHKLGADVLSLSVIGSIDLDPIKIHADFIKEPISTDSAKGKLFVVNKLMSPAYIQYDSDTGEFTGVKLTIKIRDMDGISEQVSSPVLFGDEITPPQEVVDPIDDIFDTLNPFDPVNDMLFVNINAPSAGW